MLRIRLRGSATDLGQTRLRETLYARSSRLFTGEGQCDPFRL